MKLIVGLGNPGDKYKNTRHNIGFIMLDNFVRTNSLQFTKKFDGLVCEWFYQGEKVILLKPQTFMNESGKSIRQVKAYYNIADEDILVIFDDLDLMFGKLKLKFNSSSGGHNGIKSIINHLGHQKFHRLKLGILNEYKRETINFVLGDFSSEEKNSLSDIYGVCEDVIYDFLTGLKYPELKIKSNT